MNASLNKLLRIIADGEYHSGESLGEALGVSRAAVWKQLQQLQALGIELTSVKGLGYCVSGGLDLLDREQILSHLQSVSSELALAGLQVEAEIDSTSQALLAASSRGENIHTRVCFAEKQTAGRGRRGRAWQSPFASNLYFSIGWRIENGVTAIEGLSLAVGVALCEALESLGVAEVQLKWPNDLLYEGKKLGGILLEINGDAAGECDLVLGVGLNVSMPQHDAEKIDQPWVDLEGICTAQQCELPARNVLAAALLGKLLPLLSRYEQDGFAAWKSAWLGRNAHQNTEVSLLMGSREVIGRVQGVSNNGALLLDVNGTTEAFIGGEVSLRPRT